jgi:hypothetical protein
MDGFSVIICCYYSHVRKRFVYALGPLKCEGGRPYLLPLWLTGDIYLTCPQETLPEQLEVGREMWFRQDGAPAHCTNVVRECLDETFGSRWIGRGGPITWPPRSPDLTPLDWYMQSLVYKTPVETQHDLVARVAVAAGTVREMSGIWCTRLQWRHNMILWQELQ